MEGPEPEQTERTRTRLAHWPLPHLDNKYQRVKWARAYDIHKDKVKSVKPVTDTSRPTTYNLIQTLSQRKLELNKEQTKTIERENKMQKARMSHATGGIDSWNYFEKNRLHCSLGKQRKRQLELQQITEENRAIFQRLTRCQPHYRGKTWREDWLKTLTLRERLTYYPRGRANQQDSHTRAVEREFEKIIRDLCSTNVKERDAATPAAK